MTEFKIGDIVTPIEREKHSGLEYGKDYMVEMVGGGISKNVLHVRGHGKRGWGVYTHRVKSAIEGTCKDCINYCKVDGLEECSLREVTR